MGAAVLVAASLIASRVLGLLRVSIFAALFGTSSSMAAYNAAFRVPDLLFTIIAGGALSSAFIPVFAGLLERNRDSDAWRVANTVLNSLFLALIGFALLALVLAPEITRVLVPGFGPREQAETANLTRIMLIQPVLLGMGGLFAAMQNSYQRFLLPAVAPVLYNLAIVVGALVFGPRFGVYAAAWAVVAGALIMFEIQIWGVAGELWRYRPTIDWRLSETREVLGLLAPRLVGLSAFQFMLLVTTFLASGLTSAGFNAITYAWVLIMFPVGAVGSSVGTAVFPTLARQSAGLQTQAVARTLQDSVRGILFLALPATVGLIILRRPIIGLLFAHGQWTAASTDATAFALAFYALAVVPLTLIEVVARGFYALRNTRTPVLIAVFATLVDIVLSIILIRMFSKSRGQGGLALATAVAVWLQIWLLIRALRRQLPEFGGRGLAVGAGAIMAATAVMGGVLYLCLILLDTVAPGESTLDSGVKVVAGVSVAVGVYLVAAAGLHIEEVHRVRSIVGRVAGSRRPGSRGWDE